MPLYRTTCGYGLVAIPCKLYDDENISLDKRVPSVRILKDLKGYYGIINGNRCDISLDSTALMDDLILCLIFFD